MKWKSLSSTKRILGSFSYGCRVLNQTYVFRQINNCFANVAKHCVSQYLAVNIGKIKDIWLGITQPSSEQQISGKIDIFKGITMGLGPKWESNSLTFMFSWFWDFAVAQENCFSHSLSLF